MTESSEIETADHGLILPLANSKNQLLQAKVNQLHTLSDFEIY